MERKFEQVLINWVHNENRKPLLVIGARQVGKSYIIMKFINENYKNVCYVDLMKDSFITDLFASDNSFMTKFENLQIKYNINLDDKDTILVVDEVQKSADFISSLKAFQEGGYTNIICAGSLLGVALNRFSTSFPVGKVNIEYMYPMDFEEFLWATGNKRYINEIKECFQNNKEFIHHKTLLELYYKFVVLGGMPEVIQNYIDNDMQLHKMNKKIISDIVDSYFKDMSQYNDKKNDSIRIERIYRNIPSELAKGNPKFVFSHIDSKDNRKKDYVSALDWLISSSLVHMCYGVTKPTYPIKGYVDQDVYKLFLNDTGILCYMTSIDSIDILMDGDYSYKGVLAENYVACELYKQGLNLNYWSRKNTDNAGAEVDFVIQCRNKVIPVEVKASDDTKSKSLNVYNDIFKPELMIKVCSKNFGYVNNLKTIPLYAVFCLKEMLDN